VAVRRHRAGRERQPGRYVPRRAGRGAALSAQEDASARLRAEREVITTRLAGLRGDFVGVIQASRDSNADDEHDVEGATIAFERSQVDALIRQVEGHLADIDDALARVADGSYGVCVSCGKPIPAGRLEARPSARTCVSCA
jgi:RNA polymerase-binding transcription factor DksA